MEIDLENKEYLNAINNNFNLKIIINENQNLQQATVDIIKDFSKNLPKYENDNDRKSAINAILIKNEAKIPESQLNLFRQEVMNVAKLFIEKNQSSQLEDPDKEYKEFLQGFFKFWDNKNIHLNSENLKDFLDTYMEKSGNYNFCDKIVTKAESVLTAYEQLQKKKSFVQKEEQKTNFGNFK